MTSGNSVTGELHYGPEQCNEESTDSREYRKRRPCNCSQESSDNRTNKGGHESFLKSNRSDHKRVREAAWSVTGKRGDVCNLQVPSVF
jgi:hypothetical protein